MRLGSRQKRKHIEIRYTSQPICNTLEASKKPAGGAGTLISLRIPTHFRKSNGVLGTVLGADRWHENIGKTNEFHSCLVRLATS